MEEIDDKVTHVAMVENYKLNEDGTRNRFDIEMDVLVAKFMQQEKGERSVFF